MPRHPPRRKDWKQWEGYTSAHNAQVLTLLFRWQGRKGLAQLSTSSQNSNGSCESESADF